MDRPFIDQEHRVCDVCGRRFLSGLVHIERGVMGAALCYECAADGSDQQRFKKLTKRKWDERRKEPDNA